MLAFDRLRGYSGSVVFQSAPFKMPAGSHLSLDISTLYLIATLAAALLGLMLLFFWRQERIAALGWWGAAYLLGAASIALWIAGGDQLGKGLSLAVSAVGFFACGLVWDAARVFHGRSPNWIVILAGPALWVGAMIALDPLDPERRMMLSAGIVAVYTALTAGELWRERRKNLKARWPAFFIPILHGAVLVMPIVLGDMMRATGTAISAGWVAVFAGELVLYAVGTVFIIFMLVSERTVTAHKTAASVDPLTGLLNRRGFSEATSRMIDREAKAGRPVTVMIFDIDHFKSVNDRFGHAAGDDILKVFSALHRLVLAHHRSRRPCRWRGICRTSAVRHGRSAACRGTRARSVRSVGRMRR